MPKETMTPKERWLAVLKRQRPDRVPMDYWGTHETTKSLIKHLGCPDFDSIAKKLHIDTIFSVNPEYTGPAIPEGSDVFGRRFKEVDYGTGKYRECNFAPLAEFKTISEIEKNYKWPEPDWWDYSDLPKQIRGKEDRPIRGGGSEPFLVYKQLRGDEQSFVDLLENPEMVHYILEKLYNIAYENTKRIYESIPGKVMITYVAEDMGSQEDLMYSPVQIRKYFIPHMKRMTKLVHEGGAFAFHHSDGAVRKIIPDLIEAGMDVLNPLQWRCKGMEREGLKKDFGDKLIFHGGVDNQYTLPFGTKDEVRKEVIDNIRILGAGGGYILAPCHNIQPITPLENIIAMYETGYGVGWS